jgi:tripartite-type tricarboxylate transporter receptor subunit TctC
MNVLSKLKHVGVGIATVLAIAVVTTGAQAAWPEKPITIIVPYAPGGITDVHSRLIAGKIEPILGQKVVVENKPGAGAQLATQFVAQAKPDGYTVLVSGTSALVMPAALKKGLPYDGRKAFDTVAMIAAVPLVWAIPTELNIPDMKGFVAYLKARKGPYNYGHAGIGSGSHVVPARFLKVIGAEAQEVGYQGTNPALVDLAAGRLTFIADSPGPVIPHIQSGKLKPLAVFAKQRLANMPDVPTIGEAGFPEAMKDDWELWQGLSVPAGTPKEAIDKLNAAVQTVLKDADTQKRFEQLGLIPILGDANYAQKRIINDFDVIVPLLKSMGIEAQ